jgi:predicted PurR-regulated permease PerM
VGTISGTSRSKVGAEVQSFINGYIDHPSKLLGPVTSIGASAVTVFAAIVILVLSTLYAAMYPDPLVSGIIRLVPPPGRWVAREILSRLHSAYLGWLRGLILGMIVLGGITYLALMLIGLQFAAFFALFTAFAMIVPYYGSLISSIVPILYALTISFGKAVAVAIIYVVAHQIDSNLIEPLIVARNVKLHPAAVAIGVVAVGSLFGFVGLIISVPIMVTIKILVEELWINPHERREASVTVPAERPESPSEVVSITVPRQPERRD